jgi:hypothetical protein
MTVCNFSRNRLSVKAGLTYKTCYKTIHQSVELLQTIVSRLQFPALIPSYSGLNGFNIAFSVFSNILMFLPQHFSIIYRHVSEAVNCPSLPLFK